MSTYTCRTNASCAREPYSSSVYSFFEGLKSQTFIPAKTKVHVKSVKSTVFEGRYLDCILSKFRAKTYKHINNIFCTSVTVI